VTPHIEHRTTKAGERRWRVHYREGARKRSKTFARQREANVFAARIVEARYSGGLDRLLPARETLDEITSRWFARRTVARRTHDRDARIYNVHVAPHLGHLPLGLLSPARLDDWQTERLLGGAGPSSVARAAMIVRAVLRYAIKLRLIHDNPASVLEPVHQEHAQPQPIAPAEVEALRLYLLERDRIGDAAFCSTLAYAGPRPQEALALSWRSLWKRITIAAKVVDGAVIRGKTKTGQRTRTIELLAPLELDLGLWRQAVGHHEEGDLVWGRRDGQGAWLDHDYRNWRRRIFQPACEAVGIGRIRPYDLRHSFASLLLYEGRPLPYVAAQLGHSVQMCAKNYAHVLDELERHERVPAVEAIMAARRGATATRSLSVPMARGGAA
jgi:integrase